MWGVATDDEGRQYYYNYNTGESSWTKPDGVEGDCQDSVLSTAAAAATRGDIDGGGGGGGNKVGIGGGAKPVPSEWLEHHDGEGRLYYANTATGESRWTVPGEEETGSSSSTKADAPARDTAGAAGAAGAADEEWVAHTDPKTGAAYYYNSVTKETTWTKPTTSSRPAEGGTRGGPGVVACGPAVTRLDCSQPPQLRSPASPAVSPLPHRGSPARSPSSLSPRVLEAAASSAQNRKGRQARSAEGTAPLGRKGQGPAVEARCHKRQLKQQPHDQHRHGQQQRHTKPASSTTSSARRRRDDSAASSSSSSRRVPPSSTPPKGGRRRTLPTEDRGSCRGKSKSGAPSGRPAMSDRAHAPSADAARVKGKGRVCTTRTGVTLKAAPKKREVEEHPNAKVAFAVARPTFFTAAKPSMRNLGPSHSGGASSGKTIAAAAATPPKQQHWRATASAAPSSAGARPRQQRLRCQPHQQEQIDPLLMHADTVIKEEKSAIRAKDLDLEVLHENLRDGTEAKRLAQQLRESQVAMACSDTFLADMRRDWFNRRALE